MTYRWLTITAALFISLLIISDNYAQRGRFENRKMQNCIKDLNLNDSQKEMINDLRLGHQEDMIKLQSELELKQLEQEKLQSSKDFTRSNYTAAVKDISAVKNKIAEARANYRMDVYDLLDDNQKKEFLTKAGKGDRQDRGQCSRRFRNRDS